MKIFPLILSMLLLPSLCQAEEREVKVVNQAAGVTLAGTLNLPDNPKALLVMATGSGQQNRDEQIGSHRPFKTIADYLATRGYATLRLDDRGAGESTGDPSIATQEDYVGDLRRAVAYVDSLLPSLPVGVIGHSEGGAVAVRLATDPKVKFIVTLAAPAWRGDSIVMSQGRALSTAMTGRWDGEQLQRTLLDIAASEMPTQQARQAIFTTAAKALGEQVASMPVVQQQLLAQVDAMVSPWYRDFLRYDPAQDIRKVNVPWLALNGSKDYQVLPENLQTIGSLNHTADTRLLDGLNHLLQRCSTGFPQEYMLIEEDIDPRVLQIIAEWLDSTL